MGFSGRFSLVLGAWIVALFAAMAALLWTISSPGLVVPRLLAALLVLATLWGLCVHVQQTNRTLARFVEALRHGDYSARFRQVDDRGFAELGRALNDAMRDLQAESGRQAEELRFMQTLIDDMPVALLTVEEGGPVRLANKAARRLLGASDILNEDHLADLGATFSKRLTLPAGPTREVLILRLPAGPQRVLVRSGTLERLGTRVRAITIEPVQATLDAIEVAAQTDLVRVLTHEILNSLTPVTSLSETAVGLLASDSPDLRDARLAVGTLARRAAGLHRFIKSYRAVASPPVPHKRHFEAAPFAAELARLFAAEWPNHQLCSEVADGARIFADPDLFAQALINLLRNAAQAAGTGARIRLGIAEVKNGSTIIEVEDNGPGIPEGLRREVFLPFFTTRAEGTGVGLNLVRQIMVAHGWQVSVTTGELGGALVRLSSS